MSSAPLIETTTYQRLTLEKRFKLPPNQRKFTWAKDQAEEFINDIIDHTEGSDSAQKGLFLGNIISLLDESTNMHDLYDGQQRFTSISLLIIALRVVCDEKGLSDAAAGAHKLLKNVDAAGDGGELFFTANKNIQPVIEQAADRDWKSLADCTNPLGISYWRYYKDRFSKAYNPIYDSIKDLDEGRIKRIIKCVAGLQFVHIIPKGVQEALDMFEKVNSRGVPLGPSDLLKNFLFREGTPNIEDSWTKIEDNAENTLVKCIRFFYISNFGMVTKKDLFKKIKNNISSSDDFLEQLSHFSSFYGAFNNDKIIDFNILYEIFEIDKLKNAQDKKLKFEATFNALKFFGITQAYPLIYSLLKSFASATNKSAHAKAFLKICELIEKFHFLFFVICSGRGNKVEHFYANISKDINAENHLDLNDIYNKLRNFFIDLKPPFENFNNGFIDISYEKNPKAKLLIHYIYDRYSNHDLPAGNRQNIFTLKDESTERTNFNIDHIMPTGISEFSEEIQNNIGNCMVVHFTDNSSWRDKPPSEKFPLIREGIARQPYYMNDFIRYVMPNEIWDDECKWDEDKIINNAKRLSKLMYENIMSF